MRKLVFLGDDLPLQAASSEGVRLLVRLTYFCLAPTLRYCERGRSFAVLQLGMLSWEAKDWVLERLLQHPGWPQNSAMSLKTLSTDMMHNLLNLLWKKSFKNLQTCLERVYMAVAWSEVRGGCWLYLCLCNLQQPTPLCSTPCPPPPPLPKLFPSILMHSDG